MNSVKMSFGGFTFGANPSSIKTEFSKNARAFVFPFRRSKTNVINKMPAVISGRGSFCGKEKRAQAQMLLAVFKRERAEYLFSPVLPPVKAYFTSLEFSVNAENDSIDFAFVFTQEESSAKGSYDFGYTIAEQGENLFDIADRTKTDIEAIVDLNAFKNPFCIKEGERVWLK